MLDQVKYNMTDIGEVCNRFKVPLYIFCVSVMINHSNVL